jgi:hypothetical protein
MKNKGITYKVARICICLLIFAIVWGNSLHAQTVKQQNGLSEIPAIRQLSHDYIIKSEKDLTALLSSTLDSNALGQIHVFIEDA